MRVPLREYRALLARYLTPQAAQVRLLSLLLLGSIALQLLNPQIMRRFLDGAQAGSPMSDLLRLAGLFLGLALAQQVLSVAEVYVGERVGWAATNALRSDLAEHCLRLDLSFHNAHTPGEMIERIDGDVSALTEFFSQFVVQVVGNGLLLLGILVVLFLVDWRVGLALAVFSLITLLVLARFRDIAVPHWKAERQASADLFGFIEERLAGTEDVRANGAERYVMRRFYGLMRDLLRRTLKASLMWNILFNISFLLFALGTAAAFGVSAWLFDRQLLTLGTVYVVFYYSNMLQRPIDQITHQIGSLQRAGAGLVRVRELLRTESRIREVDGGVPLPGGALALELRSVSFAYSDQAASDDPARDRVLHELSLRLAPGRVLGLLGRTGSGKTTLTRLLLRLYDPEAGQVCLGTPDSLADVREVPLADLRRRVGMVTQNIQLFRGTVRDNLTLFDPEVPDDAIWTVIRDLGLTEWLSSLPHGLDSLLESGGGGLSAGEAQLLAFARIFLRDPGLVILDEASSRLDPATEQLVERAVERLVRGRTAIIIAHRLHTVHRADEILILDAGRVLERGDRTELAAEPASHFRRLLQVGLEEMLA